MGWRNPTYKNVCYNGIEKWLLKIDKDENPETLPYCAIDREIVRLKNIPPLLKPIPHMVECILEISPEITFKKKNHGIFVIK